MKRLVAFLAIAGGLLAGVAVAVSRELRKPVPFPRARLTMNRTINPLLLRLGFVGGHNSHLGTIEHVGRTSGARYLSPIYPHIEGDTALIPVPLREHSQWAKNVLAAGRCRLQVHETLYDLDQPQLIPAREVAHLSPVVRSILDRFGWEYLVLRRVAEIPGTFAIHRETELPAESTAQELPAESTAQEPPLDRTYALPSSADAGPVSVEG
jgi:hypothetical protein